MEELECEKKAWIENDIWSKRVYFFCRFWFEKVTLHGPRFGSQIGSQIWAHFGVQFLNLFPVRNLVLNWVRDLGPFWGPIF